VVRSESLCTFLVRTGYAEGTGIGTGADHEGETVEICTLLCGVKYTISCNANAVPRVKQEGTAIRGLARAFPKPHDEITSC